MPLITVWNAGVISEPLRRELRYTCLTLRELGLKRSTDVTVCFVGDRDTSVEDPVIVIVELLFNRPERTQAVREKLAQRIGYTVQQSVVGHNRGVEVLVRQFTPERDAFWSG